VTPEQSLSAIDQDFEDDFLFELIGEELSDGEVASMLCFGCRGCNLCGSPILGGP
jgi:hypothetical protein